jgi:cytochrome c oxidase subunit 1
MEHKPSWFTKYVFSTNHKTIAVQYLITGLIFLAVGGVMAFLIRWQLAYPWQPIPIIGPILFPETMGAVMPEVYPMLFTMHGGIMVFFAVTPIILGALGNYTIPLEIGARDMALPRLNMISYWSLFIGSIFIAVSFFLPGGAAGTGWTIYPPLSSSLKTSPGFGSDFFILGLVFDAVSILAGGLNYLVTVVNHRTRGLTYGRLSLTTWGLSFSAILNTLWLPLVAAALVMVLSDRRLDTAFFVAGPLAPRAGGQPLLYQHLFWGFGHPEVYILIFPVWGLVGDLLSVFSRKPAFGYKATVISMFAITVLSGIVWGHHMFTSGMNPLVGKAFVFLTISISVPTAIFFFNWLATLWKGSIRFELPMYYALGVVFVFAIGGLTGLFHAIQTFDIYIHDTYFVVGHFHFTLAASVLFGVFAFIYFWFPKMFGRELFKMPAKIHFWLSFVLINALFTTMMIQGLHGHMRRIADATAYEFLKPYQQWDVMMGWMALALVLTQILFFLNFLASVFFGRKASRNPWEAGGVAWDTNSPPDEHNFKEEPVVYCGPHEYGVDNPEGTDFYLQTNPKAVVLEPDKPAVSRAEKPEALISTTKLGMWFFLVSEIMLFTGLIGSYVVLRFGSAGWPDPSTILNTPLLGVNTFVLIVSSLTMATAVYHANEGHYAKMRKFLLATAGLGLTFLGIKAYDYAHMWHHGFSITSSLFGSSYYLLTGFHALHVLSGVVVILCLWFAGASSQFSRIHARVESTGLYWHFIDIVWVILFAILCLL